VGSPGRSVVAAHDIRVICQKAPAICLPACTPPSEVGVLGRHPAGKVPRLGDSPLIRPACGYDSSAGGHDAGSRGPCTGRPKKAKGNESWGEAWRVETPHASERRRAFGIHTTPTDLREKPSRKPATWFLSSATAKLCVGTRAEDSARPDWRCFLCSTPRRATQLSSHQRHHVSTTRAG
jgi:hypothetical protein